MSTAEFEGRHVVVTGGAGALGGAIVRRLAGAGAICHVPEALPSPAEPDVDIADRVRLTPGVNLADDEAARSYYESLPPIFASVHAVGGFGVSGVLDTSLADLESMFRINAATSFLSCREAIRSMRRSGGGRIVNVAARPVLTPTAGLVAYTASKAAVASMTQCLAEEVYGDGILVNAVLPSIIDTPANRAAMPDADHASWPKPDQLAEAVAFLASPRNELTWGALVPVYGQG